MTREIDLNNPMGLKQSDDVFQGERIPSPDPVFKCFLTMMEGVRAGAKTLRTYYEVHGLGTVTAIINRWAPDIENDVPAYIDDVCQQMQVNADDILDLDDRDVMAALVQAIIWHENGQTIDDDVIETGVKMAFMS